MTKLKMLVCAASIALLSAVVLSADVTDTIDIAVTPNDTLTNLFLLYSQGDVSRGFEISGSAPANVTTTFTVPVDTIPLPIPGSPFFSVIGVYTPASGPSGVYVALDPTDAFTLISSGTSFDNAFSSFSPFLSEADLIAAMQNPDGIAADGFTGGDIVSIFADTPQQQSPPLFAALNLSGSSDATLVKFSDATSGGSVEASIPSTAVPEPATGWMLGAVVLALAGAAARWHWPADSKRDPRSELDSPIRVRSSDGADGIASNVCIRFPKVRAIQEVERISPEL
jgi:hypothetical protein